MFKNRNGYWMDPRFCFLNEPDDGGAGGEAGAEGSAEGTGDGEESANNGGDGGEGTNTGTEALNAEIARLKAEMAKQKAAMDKATKEAGDAKKALKAKMTQEEIDAQAKQEAEEKLQKELDELRRENAKGKTVKSIMGKLGLDEETSGNLADHLYGATDVDNALLEIQKAWQVKEAALRKEFGKITGPGAGADSNSPEAQAIRRAQEYGQARKDAQEKAQKAMNAYMR